MAMKTPVYFISDIHLMLKSTPSEQKRRENLYRLMDKVKATGGSLFFVGDLFDFYFEYPDVIPKAFADFYTKALDLKNHGVELHFSLGNHDYWVKDFITNVIMDNVYFGDTTFLLNNKQFYVTHGDGLLSWDRGYRLLKKIVRSRFFIGAFQWIHPTISYRIAKWISRSGYNENIHEKQKENIRSEIKQKAKEHIENGFDYMICGHYHLGEIIKINNGKLAIMGDWFSKPTYAYFDGEDLKMYDWNLDE